MKVLIVGASGSIGGEVFAQCLAHPSISSVVAFVRRDLPSDISNHPKLTCVLVKDFAIWPEEELQKHADAVAMIWNMGSYAGSLAADLEYPVAFLESMIPVLEKHTGRPPFRYVHLSGKFVRQDQDKRLWFMEKPRKIKGLLETKALALEDDHKAVLKTLIVKPGGVVTKNMPARGVIAGTLAAILGANWAIRIEELGAFMTYLAIDGDGEEPITETARMVAKGRELLEQQK